MLAVPGHWRVRVLAVVVGVRTARHLYAVTVQLVVMIFAGCVTQSKRLALRCQVLVAQRAEAAQRACNGIEDAHE